MEWYESISNLTTLAKAIQDKDGTAALDTAEFLEKPWKWALEWKYLELTGGLEGFVEIE